MSEYWDGVPGKDWGTPLSPELVAFIDALDCPGRSKTRLKNACKNCGVTEVGELRDNLHHLRWVPNLGHKSIGYVRLAFGAPATHFDPVLARRLSVGG